MADWKKAYPNCTTTFIYNAGHVANMDNSEEFNRVLDGFLKEV